jgi:integrase
MALQWGDIDWHGRFIEVRRNYVCGKITRPKNGKSRRVDMSQHLAEVLHQLLTQRKTEKLQGKWVE